MAAHLRSPDLVPAPTALQAFLAERRFHRDFGVPSAALTCWPVRKIVDYLIIMQELDKREAAQANASGGVGASARPPATDTVAYDRLRAAAGPPPTPPPA